MKPITLGAYSEPAKFQLVVSALPEGSVPAVEFMIQEWGQFEDEVVVGLPEVQELYDFLGEWLEKQTSRLPVLAEATATNLTELFESMGPAVTPLDYDPDSDHA